MNRLFDSSWVLRITALVLALLLFFYVKTILDNEQQDVPANNQVAIIKDVPLEVYYDTDNLIVTGLPKTVDVTIEGPMQIVLKTKLTKDFKVFVDLNSLLIGEHRVTIQDENFSDKLNVSIDPETVDVTIEEKVTKEVRVDPEMNTSLLAEDFELKSMTSDPSTVLVTGAKSVIENIDYVKATVSGQKGINAPFEQYTDVKVLDSNLNKLDVIIEPETVKVRVDVYQYSKEIPIRIKQTGSPKDGVTINSLTPNIEKVKVFGPKSIIDSLEELVVEFDVSAIDKSDSYNVDLVVPNGATKLSSGKIKIKADVTVEQPQTKTVQETDTNQ